MSLAYMNHNFGISKKLQYFSSFKFRMVKCCFTESVGGIPLNPEYPTSSALTFGLENVKNIDLTGSNSKIHQE